ncbi:MAG TPA: DUF952 domain-containing protein [Micropepsaceae bacterium]|jgi:uncharacterized protein (DUF952 family)|nr:DUF952 domain-containing protein [Micropepsaceae bacterium]
MAERVYKILRGAEWEEAQKAGIFRGSADDNRDGFIHLSAANQVRATFARYFAAENCCWLVALEVGLLEPALKWELSRGGEKFPHLYAELPLACVEAAIPIRRGAEGHPIFPPEIP